MTAVDGYLSLVSSGKVGDLNERQASFIQTARDNLDRMNRLVSDLNDISLIETNHVRLDLKPVDVLETVKDTAAVFQNQIDSKQQQLNIEAQKELPQVQADRLRLVQILSNLIGNASKYTPVGGSITIGLAPVQNGKGQAVQFSIKDTGIGIGDEEKQQVFQKFFRSADQEVANIPGTGLGLNLTRQLVTLHQGQIWFESELREGSTFYFNIPAVQG
jgi:signal transduction histidine kinase